MKNNTRIVLLITAVILIFAFAACDSLVAPIAGRNNPNDPSNPTPAAINFTTILNSDATSGNRFISLGWNDGENASNLGGYLIVRKKGSAPATIWDGEIIYLAQGSQNYEDWEVDQYEYYPVGYRVYYSIFSFGGKWSDINEDEKLSFDIGSRTLYNYENYNFVGPVSDSVIVTAEKAFSVYKDGDIDENSTWDMGSDNFIATATVPQTEAFIKFNIDEISGAKIMNARLGITTYDPPSDGTMGVYISMMKIDWEGETWNNINYTNTDSFDNSYDIYVSDGDIPTAPTGMEVNLTDIVNEWSTLNSPNFGIRIHSSGGGGYGFQSSEHSGDKPFLAVKYYYE